MHPNPVFRGTDPARDLAFLRARGFGTLSVNGPEGPLAAHVPFTVPEDARYLEAHLLRSNPVWRALEQPQHALLSVMGPDGYISPDWYGVPDQVPTWNYVALAVRGTLTRSEGAELRPVIDDLSAEFEERLNDKTPWTSAKMTPEVMTRMMRAIVPVRLTIATIDSTWKLGQNKPEAARLGAAAQVQSGSGADLATLAALMQAWPDTSAL